MTTPQGPLSGLKVIELGGLGPGPVCATLLSDSGARVVRIERPAVKDVGIERDHSFDITLRGRRRASSDLRNPAEYSKFMQLVASADFLIDPYRPGAVERLGIGPADCWKVNPRLVYGRLTGWGQDGPLAQVAGHDINYLALSGALQAIGTREKPIPPLNLVADMGGGAMFMAFGLLAAYLVAQRTGQGQVVDVGMVDCSMYLSMGVLGLLAEGKVTTERESNLIDGAAPYYGCYETADGKHIALGAIERRFFAAVLQRMDLGEVPIPNPEDRSAWRGLREKLQTAFKSRTRDDWVQEFADVDACVTPVLDWHEAAAHPQNRARGNMVVLDGILQPSIAPRFSATPGAIQGPPARNVETLDDLVADWG